MRFVPTALVMTATVVLMLLALAHLLTTSGP